MSTGIKHQTELKGTVSTPVTNYDQPPATLKNFPSSITNGITEEGGLYSLTFKSVACAELVENYDRIRRVILKPSTNDSLTRISSEKFDGKALLSLLKQDIEKLNEKTSPPTDDLITKLKRKLEDSLTDQDSFTQISSEILKKYKESNPDTELIITDGEIHPSKIAIPGLEVSQFDEAKHGNLEEYQNRNVDVSPDDLINIDIADESPELELENEEVQLV